MTPDFAVRGKRGRSENKRSGIIIFRPILIIAGMGRCDGISPGGISHREIAVGKCRGKMPVAELGQGAGSRGKMCQRFVAVS